jgi:hypothetical protein
MDKKYIIGIVTILILGLGIYIWFSSSNSTNTSSSVSQSGDNSNSNSISPTNDNIYPLGDGSNIWDEALSPFAGSDKKSYLEIVADLKSGKINFVWEVWALRKNCPEDYTPGQCDGTLLAYIDSNFDSPDREKIKELYTSYFKYENEMRQLQTPEGISFEDRYEMLKEKRRSLLGDEKSDLIFGMEESQVKFMEGSQNFINSTKNLNPDERVKKFEELRKKTYGSYYDSVMSREDKFDHYSMEIQLREKEISKLSGDDKEKKLQALEIKYFGKERAEQIAKSRKEDMLAENRLTDLGKKEQEFLSKNPNLSQKEKDQKIREMRVKILGEEEADAYARRIQFEKETGKNL